MNMRPDNAPPPQIKDKYDVFVSFRGKDIRAGFLSFLAEAFPRKQINAFVDDKLRRGEEIRSSLVGAIQGSSVSVIMFSENYASSRWCLNELVEILERRDEHGQAVIPVFYGVDPTDVRHQTGSCEAAFRKLARRYDPTMVQIWRDALDKSATLSGIKSSEFRNEAELCNKIINDVLDKLTKLGKPILNSQVLVGIGKPVADIEVLLGNKSKDVRIIGIWGMGGIGKTTIAEYVFNKIYCEYEGSCFLANVREESSRHGKYYLKEKLLSKLLDGVANTKSPNYLSEDIVRRIGHMKILIVLDDVSDPGHLELFGNVDNFGSGSRIIVTTRDKQLLRAKGVDDNDILEVGALSSGEALDVFNLVVFNQSDFKETYSQISEKIVDYAKGIPLVLKVLGGLLRGKGKEVWESKLDKLKKMPSKEVYDVMRISYDDLDRKEQEIFLDLACFFNGLNMKVDFVKALLKDGQSDNSVVDGLQCLNDKALIIISKDNVVSVHDKIQEMAWEIVRRESNGNIGSQSRLGDWDADDIGEVLENDKGAEAIRSMRNFILQTNDIRIIHKTFNMLARMNKLRFLDIHGQKEYHNFPPEKQSLPNKLRYLCWNRYPLKSLPENFSAENLVMLNLSDSRVEKLWDGVQNLVNLKQVDLHHCHSLKEIPDFSNATNLEELNASDCKQLTNVHPSIFTHKLEKLDLSGCISLTSLTSNVQPSRLSYLNLEMCFRLKEFSVTSENMIELNLRLTRVSALPPSFRSQRKLEILNLQSCYEIESLPSCMVNLTRLRVLKLRHCQKLQTLPELPPSLETLLMDDCLLLKRVMFPLIATEQFHENKKRVEFWNCKSLVESSLMAIKLNARINVMKFAQQHLSALENGDVKNYDDYLHNYHSYQALHVFPGSIFPEWLVYKTWFGPVIIDLSSSPPPSPLFGFILCFIIKEEHKFFERYRVVIGEKLKLKVTISDGSGEDEKHSVEVYVSCENVYNTKNHVCVIYDERCSRHLSTRIRSQNLSRFKLKATTWFTETKDGRGQQRILSTKFGVSLISISEYDRFYEALCTDMNHGM